MLLTLRVVEVHRTVHLGPTIGNVWQFGKFLLDELLYVWGLCFAITACKRTQPCLVIELENSFELHLLRGTFI